MSLAGKADILERVFVEGDRAFNESYIQLLKPTGPWGEFTSVMTTSTQRLDLPFVRDFPRFRERTGGAVAFGDLLASSYSITPRRFDSGIKMMEDDIDDDTLDMIIQRVRDMTKAPAIEMERLAFNAILSGIATTNYGACYDGVSFFNASHPLPDGSTQSNYVAGGGATAWYLLDARGGTMNPIIMALRKDPVFEMESAQSSHRFATDEVRWAVKGRMWPGYGMWQRAYCDTNTMTDTRLWTAIETLRGLTNDEGVPLGIQPTHLLVAPDTEQVAREILERTRIQGTQAGLSNEPVQGLGLRLVVSPYLS